MDFGTLLQVAKSNNVESEKNQGNFYRAKLAPPKRESKDSKRLSDNIQKFLQKREQEEQEKKRAEREKVAKLLAMRDDKAKNKIKKMLKVTKSANKSVLDDCLDTEHTAVTLAGGDQCDQDDYGYVSNVADALYQKYIEKVKDVKEDKGFSESRPQSIKDLSGTKERVKAAINKEIEEKNSHTRTRIAHVSSSSSTTSSKDPNIPRKHTSSKPIYDPEQEREEEERKKQEEARRKAKNRKPAPPPMDFHALLKLAEKKQHEPIEIVVPVKKKEPERLLTSKEKREIEERQRAKEEREKRKKEANAGGKERESGKDQERDRKPVVYAPGLMQPNGRIPKLNQTPMAKSSNSSAPTTAKSTASSVQSRFEPNTNKITKISSHNNKTSIKSGAGVSSNAESYKKSTKDGLNVKSSSSTGRSSEANAKPMENRNTVKSFDFGSASKVMTPQIKSEQQSQKSPSSNSHKTSASSNKNPYSPSSSKNPYNGPTRDFPPRDFPPRDIKTNTKLPESKKQTTNQRPSGGGFGGGSGYKLSNQPKKSQAFKRRILDDDDSEYDSEMDDFIDDGDAEEDYSSHIKAIFGYDKARYRDLDDEDDAAMESNFAQQQREEFISKKIGIQEDLEDMRQEALEKKRKMLMKKRKI